MNLAEILTAPKQSGNAAGTLRAGQPSLTLKLRKQYGEYVTNTQSAGDTPKKWDEWLDENGYGADDNGNAYPKD